MPGKLDAATETMVRNLESSTGRTLAEWIETARASGHTKHSDIVKHLQTAHELTFGYATLVTHAARGGLGASADEDDAVNTIYSGTKSGLRPIHDAIVTAVRGFGSDIEVAPKKGYVSLRRAKQFALVQPSTATRVDVGINLKGAKPTARLEVSGSFNAMVSHRVRVEKAKDVDAELTAWLQAAYDAAQ